jgi:glutathione S-transferase
LVDAILTDISYWVWAERDDAMPDGLRVAAQRDLDRVYATLERDLAERQFLCGEQLSIAEIALFPHLVATRSLGVSFDRERFPQLMRWFMQLRDLEVLAADVRRAKTFLGSDGIAQEYERRKIFWRGDRLEWLLARGYHQWLVGEIEADRVLWPGLALPAPR